MRACDRAAARERAEKKLHQMRLIVATGILVAMVQELAPGNRKVARAARAVVAATRKAVRE